MFVRSSVARSRCRPLRTVYAHTWALLLPTSRFSVGPCWKGLGLERTARGADKREPRPQGLLETEHPYAYASRACFGELLACENAAPKAVPLVARMVPSIRAALISSNKAVFEGAVEAVRQLSEVVGEALNEHIHVFVVQMNKRSSDKDLAPKIMRAMQTFEERGGVHAYKVIKAKVPTYCSVNI